MKDYIRKNKDSLKTIGISFLAIFGAQILQGILFLALTYFIQKNSTIPAPGAIAVFLSFLAVFAGGFFQGRLITKDRPWLWLSTAAINSFWPVLHVMITSEDPLSWIRDLYTCAALLGNLVLWYIGAKVGVFSQIRKPSSEFDSNLMKIVGFIVGLLIVLNIASWASINLSSEFRMAKRIDLPTPPDSKIVEMESPDPWIANFRKFEMEIPAGSSQVIDFYKSKFSPPGYEEVTATFQSTSAGEWKLKEEQIEDKNFIYQGSSAHWRDVSGKVMVSIYLHAEKKNQEADWSEGIWKITGIVFSRPYADPPTQTPSATEVNLSGEASSTDPIISTEKPTQATDK